MSPTLEKTIRQLGYGGLIPFVALTFLMWVTDIHLVEFLAHALAAYAVVIVSFLGGIHWGAGFARPDGHTRFQFVWGVTPSVLGWLALLMPAYASLPLLGLIVLACYAVDRKTYPAAGLAHWLPMRQQLTLVATLSCLLGAAAV